MEYKGYTITATCDATITMDFDGKDDFCMKSNKQGNVNREKIELTGGLLFHAENQETQDYISSDYDEFTDLQAFKEHIDFRLQWINKENIDSEKSN